MLIVDDRHETLELVSHILTGKPFELLYTNDGSKALHVAKTEQPDIILMDWEMPHMNGVEATRTLKSDESTQHIPIVMATGVMTAAVNLQEAMEAGADEFLRKPFDPIEFMSRINSMMRIESQKKEIALSLEQKERELASQKIFEVQLQGLLSEIDKKVKKLTSVDSDDLSSLIRQIEREIKRFLHMEKSWENFVRQFEMVHPGFFSKLIESNDKLTVNEQKLCGYIKMGLSNQEITVSANVQNSTLKKALNVIKKKLDLGPDDDLRNFINQI